LLLAEVKGKRFRRRKRKEEKKKGGGFREKHSGRGGKSNIPLASPEEQNGGASDFKEKRGRGELPI